jgi:hypothetical protein
MAQRVFANLGARMRNVATDDLEAQANELLQAAGGFGRLPGYYKDDQLEAKTMREASIVDYYEAGNPIPPIPADLDLLGGRDIVWLIDRTHLTPRQYDALRLHCQYGSFVEVGRVLMISKVGARKHYYAACRRLGQTLRRYPWYGLQEVLATLRMRPNWPRRFEDQGQ